MKTFARILGLALLCSYAFAADLQLTDGRELKDAAIMAQTPRTVTIRHATGLSSVAKTLLPLALRAQYPVDETAAREADARAAQAQAKAREFEKAEAERAERMRAQRAESAAFNANHAANKAARDEAESEIARNDVQRRAEAYFNNDYAPVTTANNVSEVRVTIADFHLVEGWDKRWFVRGKCFVKFFQVVTEYPYYSAEVIQENNRLYNRDKNLAQKLDYTPREVTRYTTQTCEFEAYYSAESRNPTFDLTLRD